MSTRAKTPADTPINVTPELIAALQAAGVVMAQAPRTPEICATCTNWKSAHMQASVGQCMVNSGLHPMMTTDRQSCSVWKLKGA